MASDPAPFFVNLFLAHKALTELRHNKSLEQSMFGKIINSFRFIDDLLSLNDDSTLKIFIQQN